MHFDTTSLPDEAAFAAANGMSFQTTAPTPKHGGALFEFVQQSGVTSLFTSPAGLEVGTLTGSIGGAQTRQLGSMTVTTSLSTNLVRSYGYIAITLERAVPQLVLDAKKNGKSIPMPIANEQRLSLEGDFDQHFTLYAPKGYEQDALYIMTPDLMALLIDETGDFDVEVVDDKLFVYSNQPFDLTNPAVWERIGRIQDVVGAKALDQTEYYSDDRVGNRAANTVGAEGSRLRMGFLPGKMNMKIFAAIFVGFFVLVIAAVVGIFSLVLSTMR